MEIKDWELDMGYGARVMGYEVYGMSHHSFKWAIATFWKKQGCAVTD